MKTDIYTKSMLTIIAFCLVVLVLKEVGLFTNAYAAPNTVKAPTNKEYSLVPTNSDGSIDVKLVGIDKGYSQRWETINVKQDK